MRDVKCEYKIVPVVVLGLGREQNRKERRRERTSGRKPDGQGRKHSGRFEKIRLEREGSEMV